MAEQHRKCFEAGILETASVTDPEIIHTHRVDECVLVDAQRVFSGKAVFLPHPDVTLREFFNTQRLT